MMLTETPMVNQPVIAKFHPLKKEQEFYVEPLPNGGIIAASECWIAGFDKHGVGQLSNGKKKRPFVFPQEFVAACMNACSPLGPISLFDGNLTVQAIIDSNVY